MNNEVVEYLEEVLEKAKEGTVQGVLAITFEPDETVGQLVAGKLPLFKAIGALEILKQDLLNQADQLEKGDLI